MTDERLEQIVAALLRTGVLLSAAVVLAGGAWWLAEAGSGVPAYGHFQSESFELRQPVALFESLTRPRPEAVIQIGLLLLILTPVARVALAFAGFLLERDRTYVWITLIVLGVLLYSMALPFGATASGHATGLRRTPMPSTSTSTTSPAESRRVAPGVPVNTRSPGMSVTQRVIQLTIVAQSKMKSDVRSFCTTSPLRRVCSSRSS